MSERRPRKAGWKQWTEDEAREALAAWEASGKALGTYAREAGLVAERLRWWKKRLGEWGPEESGEPRLVPVVTASTPQVEVASRLSLQLPGGASVELEASAQTAAWVAAVALHLARVG